LTPTRPPKKTKRNKDANNNHEHNRITKRSSRKKTTAPSNDGKKTSHSNKFIALESSDDDDDLDDDEMGDFPVEARVAVGMSVSSLERETIVDGTFPTKAVRAFDVIGTLAEELRGYIIADINLLHVTDGGFFDWSSPENNPDYEPNNSDPPAPPEFPDRDHDSFSNDKRSLTPKASQNPTLPNKFTTPPQSDNADNSADDDEQMIDDEGVPVDSPLQPVQVRGILRTEKKTATPANPYGSNRPYLDAIQSPPSETKHPAPSQKGFNVDDMEDDDDQNYDDDGVTITGSKTSTFSSNSTKAKKKGVSFTNDEKKAFPVYLLSFGFNHWSLQPLAKTSKHLNKNTRATKLTTLFAFDCRKDGVIFARASSYGLSLPAVP